MGNFTTNSRIIDNIFNRYRNTFLAFCELINNSIHANSKTINIKVEQNNLNGEDKTSLSKIEILDDGTGVSKSEFKRKILEIGTNVKEQGYGIGRFASLQIGSSVIIETVALDKKQNIFTYSKLPLDGKILENQQIESIELNDEYKNLAEKEAKTYYKVIITDFYPDEITKLDSRKKIHRNFSPGLLDEAIFIQYPMEIIEKKVTFIINGKILDFESFIIGEVIEFESIHSDTDEKKHKIQFKIINYRTKNPTKKIFLRTKIENLMQIVGALEYKADIPDENGWLIYCDSEFFDHNHLDVSRNLSFSELNENVKKLLIFIKDQIDSFFVEKFVEYFDFSKKLESDQFYPYLYIEPTSESKKKVFNQIAFHVEKEYNLIKENKSTRRIIYSLLDKAINQGDIKDLLEKIITLNDQKISSFINLLKKSELEDIIKFCDNVASKLQFLDLLYQITYGEASKHIQERKELHKIIERKLWIFGEEYENSPNLFSDKNLRNNLESLREKYLNYEYDQAFQNQIESENNKDSKSITDLFFFNEKKFSDSNAEILIVELKAPTCKLTQKELMQIDKYTNEIEEQAIFPSNLKYKLILISSDFNTLVKKRLGMIDPTIPSLYYKGKEKQIEVHILKWSDLISSLRNKLSYMSNSLQVKDRDLKLALHDEFPLIGFLNLNSKMNVEKN
ncbi:ATP-binding protein [Leptospira sp. WS60.C2]